MFSSNDLVPLLDFIFRMLTSTHVLMLVWFNLYFICMVRGDTSKATWNWERQWDYFFQWLMLGEFSWSDEHTMQFIMYSHVCFCLCHRYSRGCDNWIIVVLTINKAIGHWHPWFICVWRIFIISNAFPIKLKVL